MNLAGGGASIAPAVELQVSDDRRTDRVVGVEAVGIEKETQKILRIRNNGSIQVGLGARSSYDSNL